MSGTQERASDPHRPRSYLAAPPLLQAGDAAEGTEILEELPGPTGLLLRAALRDLMLWIETPERERRDLFESSSGLRRREQIRAADLDPDLWTPLLTLAALTDDPVGVDRVRPAHACASLARWAAAHRRAGTRLAFTQASALMRPSDAALALEVARLARDRGQRARAESWFRHAVVIARGSDWESYVWAFVGLGVLYLQCGNWPAARIVMTRALQSARRRGLRPLEGVTHHHLFHLSAEANRIPEAYQHVREALAAYGTDNPGLLGLVADVGRFWLHLGNFERSLPMFEQARECITDPNIRAMVAANVVRAAACLGDRGRYEHARGIAVDLIRKAPGPERLADAYEALAHGDLSMEEWTRAEAAAREALSFATATGNAEIRLISEVQLECAATGHRFSAQLKGTETPGVARQADRLAEDLTRAVEARLHGGQR